MEYDYDCDCDYDCVYCFVSKISQAHGSPTMAHPLWEWGGVYPMD